MLLDMKQTQVQNKTQVKSKHKNKFTNNTTEATFSEHFFLYFLKIIDAIISLTKRAHMFERQYRMTYACLRVYTYSACQSDLLLGVK